MKRVLVTGARAPAALDLIRKLALSGFDVYAADSVHYPLSRASNKVTQYFIITSPTENIANFINDLKNIIIQNNIELLIPTCEEVFFISKYQDKLAKHCVVFCDKFEKLSRLHNKHTFLDAAKNCGALIPETKLISNRSELGKLKEINTKVFKPVFSRFATQTLILPEEKQLLRINASNEFPWVAQQYIHGTEYCTYSIAVAGKLQAHSCYQPTYRAGLGSGIYFTPFFNQKIQNFVSAFIKKQHYTGQIGFDFILTNDHEFYVIECNPRATSGIHCLPDNSNWKDILSGKTENVIIASDHCKMVSLAMFTFGLKYILKKSPLKLMTDLRKAKDAVWLSYDILPSFYQFLSLAEIIFKSMKWQIPLKDAATADIEWNGEVL
jgi:predicted ATP-grasp superfamily ATP-dependent carboligase